MSDQPCAARPLRVMLVCTNLHSQGIETHAVHFARACQQQGVICLLAAQSGGFIERLATQSGVPTRPLKITAAADLLGLFRLWRLLRREKIDVLLGSDAREFVPIVLAGWLARVRTWLFRHVNYPLKQAEAWALPRWSSGFLPVSRFTRQTLLQRGVEGRKATVLYNPVDIPDPEQVKAWRSTVRTALGIAPDTLLVGFVGRMSAYKGAFQWATTLNEALPQAPRLQALWLGPEDEHAAVRATLNPADLPRHHWTGWQLDVRPYYAALDLIAVPSLVEESFGRVSIEAQACGVPVFAHADAGGLSETLRDGITGRLLPRDPHQWARAVLDFAAQPDEARAQQGQAARQWVQDSFSPLAVVSRFRAIVDGQV